MQTLLLVDGSSYLYRAFHALPDLRNRAGEPTGAVYGVISMLRRLRKEVPADYIACVFDAKGKTFRDDWYPAYKANRPPMPDELRSQLEPLHAVVRALGWPLLMVEGVEADDVIGTLATQARQRGMRTVISTGDKDMAQLVSAHTTLENNIKPPTEILDRQGVYDKFGVWPEQIVDYLSLVGDAVDNVPGVDKCGPKTAAKWLAEYQTLDALLAASDRVSGKVGEHLRAARDWLPMARKLVTIRCDVPLDVPPEGLAPRAEDLATLAHWFERLEFKTWGRELAQRGTTPSGASTPANESVADIAAPRAPAQGGLFDEPPTSSTHRETAYHTVLSEEALAELLQRLDQAPLTALDTETTSLQAFAARIVGLSFAMQPGEAWYLPLAHRHPGDPQQLPFDATLARLKPWLEDPSKPKLGQHLKYDQHVLANHGIALRGVVHDTLLQSYVVESHLSHDLDSLARRHLGQEPQLTYEQVAGKGAKQIGFDEVDIATASRYSGEDADLTLQVHLQLSGQISASAPLQHIYQDIEIPVREVLFRMERNGMLLDSAALARQSHELGQQLLGLEQRAHELAGQPFNLNSPKQLQEVLFSHLGISTKGVRKTASGGYSTDEDVLQHLAADHPLPKLLLSYRGLAKLKSTYTDKLPLLVQPSTGRVHTTFGQATAATGRLASTDPNLQNIPIRTAEGRRVREAFIAPAGHRLVSADYSQIELRIMAHLSGDQALLDAFAQGRDIHRATAAEVFGIDEAAVSAEQRRYAKVINFGLIYGMSAFGLASQLEIERSAAQAYIDRYFMRYPGVAHYMQRTREQAHELGYVETVFGRRLWLPDVRASNAMRRQGAERAAINAPMQGTAADLIKLAMIAVQDWLDHSGLATRLVLQVHDELVLEVPEHECDAVRTQITRLMCGVAQLDVPLEVSVGMGHNWDEAH